MSIDTPAERLGADRLLKATSTVGLMTTLSRITGLARDIAFSAWLGSGIAMDAFTVAFKIPNLLRRFFAEGAFSQAFVPVISEVRVTRGPAATRELAAAMVGTLGAILLVVTIVGVVAAPAAILVFAPGFRGDGGRFDLAVDMLRFTFPYVLFVSLTAFAGGLMNAHRRFAVAAFTPVLLNVVLILAGALLEPRLDRPGLGLAIGVFAAGVVQLGFQIPFLRRLGVLPRPRWAPQHADVRRIFGLMVPALFGSSVAQISILLDTLIASFLAAGSISWLYYSDRLVEFPLGVFGIALATAILPRLSEHHASAATEGFSATLDWALRLVLVIGVPAAVGLALIAKPLLVTLFYRGEFTLRDVDMAAASLRAYAPGLVGFILVKVLAPGYFARQDTRAPVRIGVQALLLGMALSVAFVVTLARTGWAPPHAGIAAATACSALLNAALLFAGLRRTGIYRARPGWAALAVRVALPSLAMAAALAYALAALGDWTALRSGERVLRLAALVLGGGGVYLAALYVCGLRLTHLELPPARRA
jgi:putative peptidoglycan lipid II flippase